MNHPYFPNQQFRCALWVNVFHRNYSQNFFKEHLRQDWNTTNLSFHTYVGARLAKSSFTHVSTPGVRSYSYLSIVFGIMALSAPSLCVGWNHCSWWRAISLFSERLPRDRHNLKWTGVFIPFKAEFYEEMKLQAVVIKKKKTTIQLLRNLCNKENHIQVKGKCWKCDKVK